MSNKWVEVEAKTIDDAIKAGLKELQLDDATEADISILRAPEGGVFGVGGTIDQKAEKKNLNQKDQGLKRIQKSN